MIIACVRCIQGYYYSFIHQSVVYTILATAIIATFKGIYLKGKHAKLVETIMRWNQLLPSAIAFFFSSPSRAVNQDNFKTCHQSGFCERQRSNAHVVGKTDWLIKGDSLTLQKDGSIYFQLFQRSKREKTFSAEIKGYSDGIIRLMIDEIGRKKPRYRMPQDEIVLDTGMKGVSFKRVSNDRFNLKGSPMNIRFFAQQGRLDVFYSDVCVYSFNKLGWFNIESEEEEMMEVYKNWPDRQPNGLQSLASDISFIGATHLLGIPEHATSLMLKSTRSVNGRQTDYTEPYRLYNLDVFEYDLDSPMALYGSIPFMMSLKAGEGAASSGIFWNNPSESWIDVFPSEEFPDGRTAHFMSEAGIIDLFMFAPGNPAHVLSQYYQVTGRPYLPPLYALGYHQCRWNYYTQEELLKVNADLDAYQIPADVIWLDIEHTDGKRYFTWNRATFPDPEAMQREMIGRRLVVIVDPHIKKDDGYVLYDQLRRNPNLVVKKSDNDDMFEGDCWPGLSIWPDFIDPDTRLWWKQQYLLGTHDVTLVLFVPSIICLGLYEDDNDLE